MIKWLNSLQPFGALLLRLVLGASMIYHGYPKVVPHGALDHHAHFVATLGLPGWLGYVSAFTEFVGGLFLVLGLLSRLAAFMVAINMLVALLTVNRYSLSLFVIAVMLTFYGPGSVALD